MAKVLSEKTGKKTSEIDSFLKELGLLFNEGITRDNFVKIKGTGAFKVVQVKERESVNVNTGERIVIPPHHKLSFQPEKKLRDMINKPFALFEAIETQEDGDGLMNLNVINDVNEINDFKDLNVIKENEEQPSPPPIPQLRIEEKPLPSSMTPPLEEKLEYKLTPSPSYKLPKHGKTKREKTKNSSTTVLLFILFFLLFILIVGAIYYFLLYNRVDFSNKIFSSKTSRKQEVVLGDTLSYNNIIDVAPTPIDTFVLTPSQSNDVITDSTKTEIVALATESVTDPFIANPQQEPAIPQTTTSQPSTPVSPSITTATTRNNNNVLARIKVQQGQRLTLIAERYYGDKVFWVYIYEYNKAQIGSNPNLLRTGMEILVPVNTLYGIDANNAASIDKATDIQRQIMEGLYR